MECLRWPSQGFIKVKKLTQCNFKPFLFQVTSKIEKALIKKNIKSLYNHTYYLALYKDKPYIIKALIREYLKLGVRELNFRDTYLTISNLEKISELVKDGYLKFKSDWFGGAIAIDVFKGNLLILTRDDNEFFKRKDLLFVDVNISKVTLENLISSNRYCTDTCIEKFINNLSNEGINKHNNTCMINIFGDQNIYPASIDFSKLCSINACIEINLTSSTKNFTLAKRYRVRSKNDGLYKTNYEWVKEELIHIKKAWNRRIIVDISKFTIEELKYIFELRVGHIVFDTSSERFRAKELAYFIKSLDVRHLDFLSLDKTVSSKIEPYLLNYLDIRSHKIIVPGINYCYIDLTRNRMYKDRHSSSGVSIKDGVKNAFEKL